MNKNNQLFTEFFETMMEMRKILDQSIAIPMDKRVTTILQLQALKYINENPKLTASKLATGLKMSSSAITQLTDRLIDTKLISRKHSQIDRRAIHFKLTPAGEKHLQKSLELIKNKVGLILEPMPDKDLQEIVRIFNNFLEKHNNK